MQSYRLLEFEECKFEAFRLSKAKTKVSSWGWAGIIFPCAMPTLPDPTTSHSCERKSKK